MAPRTMATWRGARNGVANCGDAEVRGGSGVFFPGAGGICGQDGEVC